MKFTKEELDLMISALIMWRYASVVGMTAEQMVLDDSINDKLKKGDEARVIPCPCEGWGCSLCCSSEEEIRGKQGVFG